MGAILLGVGALAVAGTAAYSSYSQSKAQQEMAQAYANQKIPELRDYEVIDPAYGYQQFLGLGQKYGPQMAGMIQGINDIENAAYQKRLTALNPLLKPSIKQAGVNAETWLRGEIPQDVLEQIQRGTAEQALFSGYGDSGMARNLTSRDLGLTSLDLMQKGLPYLADITRLSAAMNPYTTSATQFLMSPAQLLSDKVQQEQYALGIYNQNEAAITGAENEQMFAQTAANSMDPTGGAIAAFIGSLGSSAMGMGGSMGGAGGGSNYATPQQMSSSGTYSSMPSVGSGGVLWGGGEGRPGYQFNAGGYSIVPQAQRV